MARRHFGVAPVKVYPSPAYEYITPASALQTSFLFYETKNTKSSEEMKQMFLEHKHHHQSFTYLFTDGSRAEGRSGVGVICKDWEKSKRINDLHSVFSAELLAILLATEYIMKKKLKKAIICSDSKSAILSLGKQPSSHPLIRKIQTKVKNLINSDIKFLWIPAHIGIQGNERADQLARNSLDLPPNNTIPCPLDDFLNHLHKKLLELRQYDWNNYPHHHLYQIKPEIKHFKTSYQNNRIKEIILARLRIGHTRITKQHMFDHHGDPPEAPKCVKCANDTIYTIKHFLLDCPHLRAQRQHIDGYLRRNNLPSTLQTILGDDHPVLTDLLFNFLFSTRLAYNI